MNMKQLRYVAVLSQYHNFTRAAEALGISQPSLSQYVKKIETEIGAELFHRVGQDVNLTDAGETYLEIGNQILALEDQLNHRIQDISADYVGTLTIGIAPYRCFSLMPQAIKQFRQSYPRIKVVLVEQITSELKQNAERGKFDLCISTTPIDEKKFIAHRIMWEKSILAVPKEYCSRDPVRPYEEASIQQFCSVPFVSLPNSQIMGKMLWELCEARDISLHVVAECQDQTALHAMVAAGVGAGLLPYSLVRKQEHENVNYYTLEETPADREIVAFYRRGQYLSTPMEKMVEILANMFTTERQKML